MQWVNTGLLSPSLQKDTGSHLLGPRQGILQGVPFPWRILRWPGKIPGLCAPVVLIWCHPSCHRCPGRMHTGEGELQELPWGSRDKPNNFRCICNQTISGVYVGVKCCCFVVALTMWAAPTAEDGLYTADCCLWKHSHLPSEKNWKEKWEQGERESFKSL